MLLFCFLFAGILISRSTFARPIHTSVKPELLQSKDQLDEALPAFAPYSPSSVPAESPEGLEHDENGEQIEKHHHSSVAAGGVIIGGLVTLTFAAVFCYIRVTRKRDHGVTR